MRMRLALQATAAAVAIIVASHGFGRAAVDTTVGTRTSMELVVFEHPDCTYCPVFRNTVAQRYQNSPQASEAPLRFVDIAKSDTARYALNAPITMVPTAVVMKDGHEVDRIAGYWGPDSFFKMVAYIIGKAE
jgi:thioredoxin-related protein